MGSDGLDEALEKWPEANPVDALRIERKKSDKLRTARSAATERAERLQETVLRMQRDMDEQVKVTVAEQERAERAEGERDEARGKVAKAGAIFAAWLFDRAEQYPNDSGIRAAFDELFRPAAEGEPFKAYEAGELDDIDWLHQEKS